MAPGLQTLLVAVVGGIAAQWFARLLRIPAIIPLLGFGILLGPEGPFGTFLMSRPGEALGPTLPAVVGLGVAVILFEGGLSLNMRDLRLAPKAVRNLLSVGALCSFLGGTLCAYYVAGIGGWSAAFLYGALVIVTGPTVIVPLLKNIRIVRRVHTILLWEGILIDAIGAITAVVTLEIVLHRSEVLHAGTGFIGALVLGPALGLAGGWALSKWLLRRKDTGTQDHEFDSLLALAGALGLYGLSEGLVKESGLGAVTCAGLVMSNMLKRDVEELRRFKGTLTTLLVSVLFMLLAANFELATLQPLWPMGFVAIGVLMLVVRPLSIALCTWGGTLTWREKVFLGWIAPRGIVAASVASLMAFVLGENNMAEEGKALVALTFSTIMVTVVLNGITAKPLAWLLGLQVEKPEGLLIVGANDLALRVAGIFETHGVPTLLVDTNPVLCARARDAGFQVAEGSALDEDFLGQQEMAGIGRLLALTYSPTINARACLHTGRALKLDPCYALVTTMLRSEERQQLELAGAKPAFAESFDLNRLLVLLRTSKSHIRSHRIEEEGKIPPPEAGHTFIPVALVKGGSPAPFAPGLKLSAGALLIGLEFAPPTTPKTPPATPPQGGEKPPAPKT